MKARSLLALAALSVFVVTAIQADDAKKAAKKKLSCPVSGKPAKDIDGSSVKTANGKVLFCCAGCPKAYAKNPAKYATKANAQIVASGQVKQAACAITGKPCKPTQNVTVAGTKVYFCCPGCKGKVAKLTGDAQLNAVFSDAAFKKAKYAAPKKKG